MKRTWSEANAEEYGQLGIIQSVKLCNFMCHDNLSFEFDPHMNFILGRNGSGKSAILTGIILALGAKSSSTTRYTKIGDFIKSGKNTATVSVTLKNCGPDAFKPDEYGDAITIERQFTKEGVSSYKLKAKAGRIVSNSKEELSFILSVMNIQIENPITVLTQETGRTFLVSKNANRDKLFKLFSQGTGLAKVHEDYNRSVQQKEDARSELESKKLILPDMEKEIKKLKVILDKKAKIAKLNKELFWALVIELEKERDEAAETLNKLKRKFSSLNSEIEQYEDELADILQNVNTSENDKKDSLKKIESIKRDMNELHLKKDAVKMEANEIQGTYSRHEREVKNIESQISGLETMIQEIEMKNESDLQEDRIRHEFAVKNLHNLITNTEAKLGILETRKTDLREKNGTLQKQLETLHPEIQEIIHDKSRLDREKQQLNEGIKDRLNVYGSEMINVLREIQAGYKAGMFKQKPIGPIGLYLNVKQPEWNFAVQECLKAGFLKNFLCDNHADAEQLTKIFAKHFSRFRPSIITMEFVKKVYDVSAHKCISEHPTLFDMLSVEDPVVANCLIDQRSIENILLVADPVEARSLMLYNPPRACSCVYSANGDMFCHSPFRKYSCRSKNQISLLKTVNQEDIRAKEEELKFLNIKMTAKLAQKKDLLNQIKSNEEDIDSLNQDITEEKLKKNEFHMKLKEEKLQYSQPKDINCLATDLEELRKHHEMHYDSYKECKEALKSKTQELSILDQNYKEAQRLYQAESTKYLSLSNKAHECQNKKEVIDASIRKRKHEQDLLKPDLQSSEQTLADKEGTVKTFEKRARSVCPQRIDTQRSSDEIKQYLNEFKKNVNMHKEVDREKIVEELEKKVENLKKAKADLCRLEIIVAKLDKMMAHRFQELQKICKNTSVSLTCAFTSYLKENNFTGYPEINFDEHTLDIWAKPEKTKSKFVDKPNLAQLSGGERSYVTIAFLLSLWDHIHMPFRILDEYDVFMDSNNRHMSIHLLINAAKSNKKIQYIFLSPLELPPIEDCDHVKVHKMPAPRE